MQKMGELRVEVSEVTASHSTQGGSLKFIELVIIEDKVLLTIYLSEIYKVLRKLQIVK